ncbi:MAG: hypothetical protein OHK0022_45430 [Roseiflexaceae bacterium]
MGARGFVIGYSSDLYLCGLRPGQPPIRPKVVLAIGVTNESLKLPPLSTSTNAQQTEAVTYTLEGHGAAWAGLINRLRQHVALNGWSDFLSVVAAYDAEVQFNSAAQSKAWLKGYRANTPYLYYHLGSCEGCPNPLPWTQRDIWDLTAGSGGPLIPQIYRSDGEMARQWSTIADILRRTPDPNGDFPGSTLTPLTFSGVQHAGESQVLLPVKDGAAQVLDARVQGGRMLLTIGTTGGSVYVFDVQQRSFSAPQSPTLALAAPETKPDGTVWLLATGEDQAGAMLTYSWDLDGDGVFETEGNPVQLPGAQVAGRMVTARVTARSGLEATAQVTLGP